MAWGEPYRVRVMETAKTREFLDAVLNRRDITNIYSGGGRGGAKTHASCAAMLLRRLQLRGTLGIMFRRTVTAAEENLKGEMEKVLKQYGIPKGFYKYNIDNKRYDFGNGSALRFAYIRHAGDYEQYQGPEYTDMAFEEATQHIHAHVIATRGSNRTAFRGAIPKQWYTFNPGGVGHVWVVDEAVDNPRPGTLYIASTADDNYALLENDPGYIERVLNHLPDWLRRQWRLGDLRAVAGAFFVMPEEQIIATYDPRILNNPEKVIYIPYHADWYGCVDWGRTAPFCYLIFARWVERLVNGDLIEHCHFVREIYKGGLELDEQAQEVNGLQESLFNGGLMPVRYPLNYGDPAIGKKLEGESTEVGRTFRSVWNENDFSVLAAKTNARVPGWELERNLITHGIMTVDPSCKALIKELRGAVYEGAEAGGPPTGEDMAAGIPDHALDASRYGIVSTFGLGYKAKQKNPYAQISRVA